MTEEQKQISFLENEVSNLSKRVLNIEKELAWMLFDADQEDTIRGSDGSELYP